MGGDVGDIAYPDFIGLGCEELTVQQISGNGVSDAIYGMEKELFDGNTGFFEDKDEDEDDDEDY